MKLIGRDGSAWYLTAGPTAHSGVRLDTRRDGLYEPPRRRGRHMPDWLDALLAGLGQWIGDRSGIGTRRP